MYAPQLNRTDTSKRSISFIGCPMIQHQIDVFVYHLKNLAADYSNPAIIMDHIPVVRDNPQAGLYGAAGLIGAFTLRRILKKRAAANKKNVALVMPSPYAGDNTSLGDASNASPRSDLSDQFHNDLAGQHFDDLGASERPSHTSLRVAAASAEASLATGATEVKRSPAQQLDDVSQVAFVSRAALSPDEARSRVIVQAALKDMGAPHTVMARTALDALVSPAVDASSTKRSNAAEAVLGKYIDFGIFDRTGRITLALKVNTGMPPAGIAALERAVVEQVLCQAGIPSVEISVQDTPSDIKHKIAPHLGTFDAPAIKSSAAQRRADHSAELKIQGRPGRPARPTRPERPPSVIAAE